MATVPRYCIKKYRHDDTYEHRPEETLLMSGHPLGVVEGAVQEEHRYGSETHVDIMRAVQMHELQPLCIHN